MNLGFVYLVEPTSAGTWTVDQNILDNENWINTDNWARRVTRIGIVGSDAVGECEVELRYGERKVGTFRNTIAAAAGVLSNDMQPLSSRLICRPNEEISLILKSSVSGTNKLGVAMDVKDIARERVGGRRSSYRRGYRR